MPDLQPESLMKQALQGCVQRCMGSLLLRARRALDDDVASHSNSAADKRQIGREAAARAKLGRG